MHKINRIPFYLVAIFTIVSISCVGSEHMGERLGKSIQKGIQESSKNLSNALVAAAPKIGFDAAKIAAEAGIKATQIASSAAIDGAQRIGVDAADKVSMALLKATQTTAGATKDISKDIVDGMVKSSATIGSEAVEKLVPVASAIAGVYAVGKVIHVGVDIYKYNYPDEKERALREDAKERIAVITTKRGFRECLMKNAKGQRNKVGLPIACEECGNAFAMTAGGAAYQDMTETFKMTYRQDL